MQITKKFNLLVIYIIKIRYHKCDILSHKVYVFIFFVHVTTAPQWATTSSLLNPHDHTDTPHSVGRFWTRDLPDAETST
jgi:hypothetical protein